MSKISLDTSFTGLSKFRSWWPIVKNNFLAILTGHNELEDHHISLENRVDNIVAGAGTGNTEIVDARHSTAKNKDFTVLTERFEELENEIMPNVVDLLLMDGQSNMMGCAEGPVDPFELPQKKAYEYKLVTDSLTTVKHPFGEEILGTDGSGLFLHAFNNWGCLSPRFAEAYFNNTRVAPLMCGSASGAYITTDWAVGGERYNKVVEKVNAAATKAAASQLIVRNRFMVWLHGETDGMTGTTKQTYKAKFLLLWKALKKDCDLHKCLIIRVSNFGAAPMYQILEAQEELAKENDDIILLTRITGTFTQANDMLKEDYHYKNAALDIVGTTAGTAAGKYVATGIEPVLEDEPYEGAEILEPGTYEIRFRTGSISEATGKFPTTALGVPNVQAAYVGFDGNSGVKLAKPIVLDGDATLSFTCLMDNPLPAGSTFASYDGSLSKEFLFLNHNAGALYVTDSNGSTKKLYESSDMPALLNTYNHFVITKTGKVYCLYFNQKLIWTVYNGPAVLCLNNLFFGSGGLGLKGKVKHFYLNIGEIISPYDADPTFYVNAEKGTT